jgi:hypothetical protein
MVTTSTSAPLVGAVLEDRYELDRLIAHGGMGDVYGGQDRVLQRPVAVKVFRAGAPAERSRFDAEVTTLAALNHPGLVHVYDAGQHQGDGFVVLELVDGPNLRSILAERGALPPDEVAALGAPVADALAYVHSQGVVHRDVTPANVLCGPDGRPRLADFGIARLLDTSRITAVASTIGTAAYMAPEQVEGADVTPAADVYALGLVLLEALTGEVAFAGPSHEAAMARLARSPDVETGVPPDWTSLLGEMTRRAPLERPSAATVVDRLQALGGTLPSVAVGVATSTPPAVVARPSVTPDADAEVDGFAATEALVVEGSTAVMPAVLRPTPPEAVLAGPAAGTTPTPAGRAAGGAKAWWWAALAILVAVVGGLATRGEGADASNLARSESTTTTAPAVTIPPTTAPPPTTAAPAPKESKGHGEGKGKGKGKD